MPQSPTNDFQKYIATLREDSPRRFTLLQQYFPELKMALDAATHHYPTSSQLYELLENPTVRSHTFGRLLPLLVECEIIGLYTERSNANRYDLCDYDPARLERLGELL